MLSVMQVIAVICVLVWFINIPRFGDPVHGNWVSAVFCTAFISHTIKYSRGSGIYEIAPVLPKAKCVGHRACCSIEIVHCLQLKEFPHARAVSRRTVLFQDRSCAGGGRHSRGPPSSSHNLLGPRDQEDGPEERHCAQVELHCLPLQPHDSVAVQALLRFAVTVTLCRELIVTSTQ